MQLYYIRHGQSVNNAGWGDPNYVEHFDAPLTETGHEQARILAEYLDAKQLIIEHSGWDVHNHHGFGFSHLYTSLMERAVHTATPIARKMPQVPFAAWTEIHESGGIYGREGEFKDQGLPGKPRSYFEKAFPELALPVTFEESGWWNRPHESEDECHLRAQRVWADLLTRHSDKADRPEHHIALVSHGGFFMHLMCAILDLPWRNASHDMTSWFLLNNCSISRIAVHNDEVVICYLNRTDHLPGHLITG